MKTKFFLIYGYIIPVLTSILVSVLPWFLGLFKIGFIHYEEISKFFTNRLDIILAYTAIMGAITYNFQTKIIHEENPHVLAVLSKNNVRKVFIDASTFQAVIILCLALLLCILSAISSSSIIGYFELLGFSLITFESIALISNGRDYEKIREKIIMRVNEVSHKKIS